MFHQKEFVPDQKLFSLIYFFSHLRLYIFTPSLPKIYVFINQPEKIMLPKTGLKMSSRWKIEPKAERLFSFQITLIWKLSLIWRRLVPRFPGPKRVPKKPENSENSMDAQTCALSTPSIMRFGCYSPFMPVHVECRTFATCKIPFYLLVSLQWKMYYSNIFYFLSFFLLLPRAHCHFLFRSPIGCQASPRNEIISCW